MIAPPAGFKRMDFSPTENFVGANGSLYRSVRNDALHLGFIVQPGHCNLAMVCHGGMLTTLADMQLSLGARHAAGLPEMLPTISLSIEFFASVPVGSWVEGKTELLRVSRNLVFAQCLLKADGAEAVARASAVLKRGAVVGALSEVTSTHPQGSI